MEKVQFDFCNSMEQIYGEKHTSSFNKIDGSNKLCHGLHRIDSLK